jgi:5-methylcytosine-specific restriction endonuclease McrA
MRQVLLKLGVAPYGGNYDVLRKAIRHFVLDTAHFTGQAWNRGKRLPDRTPTGDYLANRVRIQSFKLKRRLVTAGLLTTQCALCNGTHWLGQPIPLELDHIDGNRHNNSLSNLRMLCPNCHALTPTYRGKNRS